VKRRKFATAGALLAALLVAALAAASVNAATSAQKSAKAAGKGWELKAGHKNSKGQNLPAKKVGVGQFQATQGKMPKFINSPTPANATAILAHDKRIPGKLGSKGSIGSKGAAQARSAAAFIPQAHSLPITHANYTSAKGLNAFNQASVGGYTDTPPDQALAEATGSCSKP